MPDVMTLKFARKYGRAGNCGDGLSESLSEFIINPDTGKIDESKFRRVAEDNQVPISKWDHLNNGQRRMLMGNVLRGRVRRGGDVRIGETIIEGIDK